MKLFQFILGFPIPFSILGFMGLIICNKHGRAGFREMCEHIFQDLQKGLYPEMRILPPFDIKLCPTCYDSLNADEMPDVNQEQFYDTDNIEMEAADKIFLRLYKAIPGRKVMCYECIQDVKSTSCGT